MNHLQTALVIHTYTAVMVSLGFILPEMDPTAAFFILLGTAFMLPGAIVGAERIAILTRALRRKRIKMS